VGLLLLIVEDKQFAVRKKISGTRLAALRSLCCSHANFLTQTATPMTQSWPVIGPIIGCFS